MAQKTHPVGGRPIPTPDPITATSDAVASLPVASLEEAAGTDQQSFLLTIVPELNPIRFAFGTDPSPDVKGAQIEPGVPIYLNSRSQIRQFRWCNGIAGRNAKIHIYPEMGR